uniref:Uncharacterized protein n=1 Tax=Opuntia streptacantha TaxID=393608 RepID=A0A7C8Z289_OPUST
MIQQSFSPIMLPQLHPQSCLVLLLLLLQFLLLPLLLLDLYQIVASKHSLELLGPISKPAFPCMHPEEVWLHGMDQLQPTQMEVAFQLPCTGKDIMVPQVLFRHISSLCCDLLRVCQCYHPCNHHHCSN